MKTVSGMPGVAVVVNNPGAAGGICPAPYTNPPLNCDNRHQNRNQIFIDLFTVYATRDSVDQTIWVDAYLYQWNGYYWVRASYPPFHTHTSMRVPASSPWTFGSPY